jgi:hypothetical protein
MQVKRNILWTGLVLVSLLMGIFLTTSDWVTCKNALPDEYMDVSLKTEQDVQKRILQGVPLIHSAEAFHFVWHPEYSSYTSFLPHFGRFSPFSEQLLTVILLI